MKRLYIFVFFLFVTNSLYAQLDTRHYIPPFYGREDRAEGSGEDIYLLISTPQTTAFDVKVTDGAGNELSFSPISVSRSTPANISLSSATGATKGPGTKFLIDDTELASVLTDEGLILTANKAFFTSVRVDESAQAGFLTSKGTAGFGKIFRSGHIWNVSQDAFRKSHSISFMATEDNTIVEVSDFGGVDFENVSEAGGFISVALNAGESYVLTAFCDGAPANLNDVSGTLVTSDKFIVVNSGSWLAGSPSDGGQVGRDIGIDQIAPVDKTGFEYILIKGEGIANENVIVVSGIDGTNIYLNGSSIPSNTSPLDAGDYLRFTASDYTAEDNMYLRSNQPVYVYQGLNGSVSTNERQEGLNYMPPVVCLGGSNVDLSDIDQLGNPIIQIIAEAGELVTVTDELGNVTDVTAQAQTVTGNGDYVTYKIAGYTGDVTVESPRPIRVSLTVESGNIGGAGFFSGFTLTPVIETPNGYNSITCIPDNLPVTLTAAGFDTYQWYRDGVLLNGETSADISVNAPGQYTARGSISGCISSQKSYPLVISLCQDDLGIAKNTVSNINSSGAIFDITYDLIVTNYNPTNPADNLQILEDILLGVPNGAAASLLSAPVLLSGTLTTGALNTNYDGITDKAILTTSSASQDASIAASSTITIRYGVRVDMTSATQPGYYSQAVVTATAAGPNNGIIGPFDSQDFSDAGTNPDPNGNNDPTELGENDISTECLITYTIDYATNTFYTQNPDPIPNINGLNGGEFSATFGLTIDRFTGQIDLSTSVVGIYTVTYDFGGLCPVTTVVNIALAPYVNRLITSDFTPVITGANGLGSGQPAGESVTVTVNGATYTVIPDGAGRWSVNTEIAIPSSGSLDAFIDGSVYDVAVTITDAALNTETDVTTDELLIDASAPIAPTVTEIFTSDLTPIINGTNGLGTAQPAGETLRVTVNGATYLVVADTNGDWQINTETDTPDSGSLAVFVDGNVYNALAIISDLASNSTTDATLDEINIDTTQPVVPTVDLLNTNNSSPTITGTWDNVDAVDLEVTINSVTYILGISTELTAGGGGVGTWALDLSALTFADGLYDVSVLCRDLASNNSNDTTNEEIFIDATAPELVIQNAPYSINNTNIFTINIQFTESVSNFDQADLSISNATIDNFTVIDGLNYEFELLPNGAGDISLDVAASLAQDNVGNQNTAASTVIVLFDNTAPVIPTVNTLITNNVVPIISGTNGLSAAQPIDETITLQINGATYSVIPDASGDWIIDLQNDVPSAGSLGALSDGNTYEVLVTITDFAGNVSADTSANELTIDTTAPQIPTITNQSTNDQSPSLAGTAEPSSQITLTLNSVNFETTANLSGNWSINTETAISTAGGPFTTLTDGTYEVLVKSTDAAGNFTLDTSSDELIIDASFPTSATVDILITNNQTPILTGNNGLGTTQPADEVVKVTVNGATYTVIPDASGNWSIATQTDAPSSGTLTIFTEGAYEVSVEVTDLGGNVSTDISSDELTIDLTAPAIPTINSLVTNNTTPTISGSAEANSLISLILNGVTFETTATIAGNWSIDTDNDTPTSGGPFTTLNEGVFDIVVTATDVAGNSSNDSTTDELNVDTTAPNIPTVDALISKLTKPIVTGTNGSTIVLPADEDLSVAINGSTFSVITDASGNWAVDLSSDLPMSGTFSDLGDGFYELSATIQDQAGNSSNDLSSNELLIDTSAPSVPTVNSANTNNQKPMLSGTAEIGSNLSLVINGVTFEPMVLGDGSWSIDLATASAVSGGPLADLAEGLYEILLTSTDQAGNTSNDSSTDEILIDTTAPATPTINQLTTNSDFPLISGTAEAGTNLVLIINAVTYSLVVPIDGAWSLNTQPATADAGGPFNALTDGLYDVVLNSTDQAGNSSVDTTIDELLIDTVSPVIPIINQLETDNTLPIITGTAEANSTIRLSLDGLIFETITLGDGTWSVNTGVDTPLAGGPFVSLSDGVYDIAVSSYDAAGNENTDNSIDELTITTVTLGIPTVNVLESTDGLPTLTGTWDQTNADELNVSFASQSFVLGVDAELTNVGNLWTLDLTNLTQPLANGVYDVVVYTSNASKNTIDATVDELTVNIVLVIAIPTVNELLSANGLPLLWGTWDEVNTSILVITVANVSYSLSANAELTTDGSGSWSLDLSSLATPLEMGVYDVEVFSSDTQGNSAVDNTTDELTVTIPELGIPTVNEVESSDGLPIITGTWDHLNALTLLVRVNSVSYNLAANTELSAQNENWTLDLSQFSSAMLNGSYEVEVNTANNTETTVDATINELFVNNPLQDLDQDNVFDIDEDLNTNGNFDDDDTDGDNIPNYLDTDDDNDQVPTIEEDYDNDGNPQNEDTDGDIIPDYLDFDDDGDGLTTLEEDVDQNGDPRNDDTDGDSIPDYLDPINDVTSKADLAISMVVSVGPYLLDQSVTYTVIVTNIGPDIATDVLVTDRLATSFGFSSAETSRGIYNELNGSWPLGELAVGRTDTLSLSLQLVEKGLIENTASVEGNELDENVENNEVLISIEVDENFEVGKGFSPNGDGINDTWKIAGIDLFLNNTVKVFNRWGNEVFSTKGYDNNSNNWDGTNQGSLSSANGRVPEGTYFYVIELEAGLSKMTGYLTIKN